MADAVEFHDRSLAVVRIVLIPHIGRSRRADAEAYVSGLACRKACGSHCDFHDLFLKNWHAECAFKHSTYRTTRVSECLKALPSSQIRMHHATLNGAWPYDGNFDDQII